MSHDKSLDLITFKNEVKMVLESEIVKRYYFNNGSIENYFNYDKELKEALVILKDKAKYDALLTKK